MFLWETDRVGSLSPTHDSSPPSPQQLSPAGVGGELPQAAASELFRDEGRDCLGAWVPQVWHRTTQLCGLGGAGLVFLGSCSCPLG